MQVAYRNYKCRNCGHIQMVSTNHLGSCIDYCHECSWKPSWRASGNYGVKDDGLSVPFNGRTYRPFDYESEVTA
jgi:hypothetical protein